ncbi:hypothetical protein EYF80_048096 [Liparis tanakae]|uniref:Uncharacterized protein n=1 Tax=Liparis tanakae TaxID=230148 RepID=A0A4Z2FLU9_9TELE|nr:hypothetical protein EYF80_048096 [Liparis tanakae]
MASSHCENKGAMNATSDRKLPRRRPVLLVGMLVSKTVPSSREPVYQQLTLSPFFGKLLLSPFFITDLKYLGGP